MKTSIFGLNFFQDMQSTDENFLKVNAKNDFCDMKYIQTKKIIKHFSEGLTYVHIIIIRK